MDKNAVNAAFYPNPLSGLCDFMRYYPIFV